MATKKFKYPMPDTSRLEALIKKSKDPAAQTGLRNIIEAARARSQRPEFHAWLKRMSEI